MADHIIDTSRVSAAEGTIGSSSISDASEAEAEAVGLRSEESKFDAVWRDNNKTRKQKRRECGGSAPRTCSLYF